MIRRYVSKLFIAILLSFVLLVSTLGLSFGPSNQALAATSTGPSSIGEWLPAPGQFVNSTGWGGIGDINSKWSNTPGSAGVSLGAFGGSIVFKFNEPIENDPKNPYGVDFTVFGNASDAFPEPAGVAVAEDDGTGKPGPWFYIAGSEHYEDSTIWDYQVTYTNPEPEFTTIDGVSIPWVDNKAGSGIIKANRYNRHAYYPIPANYPNAPANFNNQSYTYSGVKITTRINAFGYPDTHPNGSIPYDVALNPYLAPLATNPIYRGDPIDISWAVDSEGKPISLTNISYVKVYNAVQIDGGGDLGEISPEITSLQKMSPDDSVIETTDLSSIVLTGSGKDTALTKQVTVTSGVYVYEDIFINADKIKVTANGTASNIFVNNTRGTSNTLIEKEITLSETKAKIVRVIAQDGINSPKIYYLSIKKGVTKKALDAAIADVNNKTQGNYTDTSWQALQNSLTEAKSVAANVTATQVQIDLALSDLFRRVQGLQTPQEIAVSIIVSGFSATANKSVYLPKADTVVEDNKAAAFAIEKALKQNKITYVNAGSNYLTSIGGLANGDGGAKSSWMYVVNGQITTVADLADYNLKSGDVITLVYTDDTNADIAALADKTALNANIAEFNALQQGSYTNESWQVLQSSLTLAKAVAANSNAIQYHADSSLAKLQTAFQSLQTIPIPKTISVSFTLNGRSAAAGKNITLAKTMVTVEAGKTAAFVIEKVLSAASIPYVNEGGNYITSVGGLATFDGGGKSGWLYSVNGVDAEVGIASFILSDNDSIVLRYTDDYLLEYSPPISGGNGGSGANQASTKDVKATIEVPTNLEQDYIVNITKELKDKDQITINIPNVKWKVNLNLEDVKASIPMITAVKEGISVTIDKGTVLKSGNSIVELLTALNINDTNLQELVKNSLISSSTNLTKLDHAFAMGNATQTVLFDKPLTLVIKNAKGQLAGFIEGDIFTPIELFATEAQGIEATKGKEKITYAFVKDNDLIIKTNHFTNFVTYTVSPLAAEEIFDLKQLYTDANLIAVWANGAISEASQKKFVEGSNGKFNPKSTTTKAEFAKILVGVLGLDVNNNNTSSFKDVAQKDWFYPYVNAAYKAGFITGYNDYFSPNEKLTREQMATIIVKALSIKSTGQAPAFTDLDKVAAWAQEDVQTIAALELMSGWDNRFHPSDKVTREMAAVVAMRAYQYKKVDQPETNQPETNQPDQVKKTLVEKQINETAAFLQQSVTDPSINSIGGDWTVLGLARSGVPVPDAYYAKYYANVEKILKEKSGKLHTVKYTEYDRVILGLTALGKNIDQVAGYSLRDWLADYDTLIKQGINGPIFALIALDSKAYEIPVVKEVKTETTREQLIDFILNREISGGGWALGDKAAESDITGMAIQALTPYYKTNQSVKAAIDRALAWLSKVQTEDGGYASLDSTNVESIAQVVVALAGLGIDPHTDSRFIKNGSSSVDALLGFAAQNGGFYHVKSGGLDNGGAKPGEVDPMATDQAMYALVAYDRLLKGQTRLYDMTDVK